MKNKRSRLEVITEILRSSVVGCQEELLASLAERGLTVTQAGEAKSVFLFSFVTNWNFQPKLKRTFC
jgi:arginine repressor